MGQNATAAYSMNNSPRVLNTSNVSAFVYVQGAVFTTVVSYSSLSQMVLATFAIQICDDR